jgi:hypothetical protein
MKRTTVLMVVLAFIAGIVFVLERRSGEDKPRACTLEAKLCPDGTAVGRTGPNCEFAACPGSGEASDTFGAILYDDFNQIAYDAAVASNALVVLYFHATWCPICAKEWPNVVAAFQRIDDERVVGFRVNFNDSETDDKRSRESLALRISTQRYLSKMVNVF